MSDVETELDFRSLIDQLEGMTIWTVSSPLEFEYISTGFEDIWGIPPEEVQDDPSRLIDAVHPDDREYVWSVMDRSEPEVVDESFEHRVVQPDGTVRWVFARIFPLYDDDGDVRQVVGATTDITEQKRREEELAVLNRVVHHDIRNDMAILLGWLELIDDYIDEDGREYLRKTLSAGAHINELTELTRDYVELVVKEDEMPVHPVSLASVVRTELDLRREAFPNAEFIVPGSIPAVEVLANEMLSSVFRNLLNNAVQHNDTPEPGVTITFEVRETDVLVRIADDGPGIPDAQKEAIFSKDATGLESSEAGVGLYLVRTLVSEYGGDVRVADNEPTGTVVIVRLPRSGEATDAP